MQLLLPPVRFEAPQRFRHFGDWAACGRERRRHETRVQKGRFSEPRPRGPPRRGSGLRGRRRRPRVGRRRWGDGRASGKAGVGSTLQNVVFKLLHASCA
jgi:hypothetical protein